jgi:hypothetical protein
VLSTLAGSGNQLVQLGTLVLVGISGLTSFFQTSQVGEQGRREQERAIHEIHQLYEKVDEFERRQRQSLEIQQQIMDSNNRQLQNQTAMLSNQESVLRVLRDNQQRYLRSLIPPQGPGP